jgi:hypothetical protein
MPAATGASFGSWKTPPTQRVRNQGLRREERGSATLCDVPAPEGLEGL